MYEIRVHGCPSAEEALALQEPIGRLLCPDPDHPPPCEVPWGFSLDDDEHAEDGDEAPVLVVGVYVSREKASQVVAQVRELVGDTLPVVMQPGRPGMFEELAEQYRIENSS
ncbi:hypothetical protein [Nocardia sp. BMG51109]|uniref:hypothetical protein n=1 Tax=Nocardia sp. BMG51109 TaxID=1056816 RepID=UPI0004B3E72B|nr:hypothetical protein [Nocardia sp. BMG51109]